MNELKQIDLANARGSAITPPWLQPYIAQVRKDAAFHFIVMAYALLGLLISIAAGVPHKFAPISHLGLHLGLAFMVPVGVVLMATLGASVGKAISPRVVAGLVLFMSLSVFMAVFAEIKSMLTDVVPFYADPFFARLDQVLHGGQDPWRLASALMPPQFLSELMGIYYIGWSAAVILSTLLALLATRLEAVRAQFVWTFLIAWPLLGNVFAAAGMSGGPILFDLVTGQHRFEELRTYLAVHTPHIETARMVLWHSYTGETLGSGIAISAFPSLHVAKATLLVLLAAKVNRCALAAALLFCAAIVFGSVQLGWHYAVDGYFSIVATVVIWKVVGAALKRKTLSGYQLGR
jgi:hypothetical protein